MSEFVDPRASYWDSNYKEYWSKRVAESEKTGTSLVQEGDAKTEGDDVYLKIFDTHGFARNSILDVGCAWGRMFPIFLERGLKVSGIDIAQSMIDAASEQYADNQSVEDIRVATAENLPFKDKSFANVVCVAVFDATFQHQSLAEFLRVLELGGRLYLTGKSDAYFADDDLALAAESGARNKGHPNFFTDVTVLRNEMARQGVKELGSYFFPRRGDFAEFKFEKTQPENFYEWMFIFEKQKDATAEFTAKISAKFSKTFLEVHKE